MRSTLKAFASDNYASVHEEVMLALQECNQNHAPAYGDDIYTAKAIELFKQHFGAEAEVLFVFGGTGANIVGLDLATKPFQSILCAQHAHINMDECGAIEKNTGSKLVPIPTPNGKLTPALLTPYLARLGDVHHAQPGVVSISQTTEYGTVYSIEEIRTLANAAHECGMLLHLDGARISNAAAALSCGFRDFTLDAGVDVLSFGGTKNGMMFGEAVVVLNSKLVEYAKYYRKQNGQLPSKQRYVAAQFIAMFEGNLGLRSAQHANKMAKRLEKKISTAQNIQITQSVDANVIFAKMPSEVIKRLQAQFKFYVWNEMTNEVRWMTSFDTTENEVDEFAAQIIKEGAIS